MINKYTKDTKLSFSSILFFIGVGSLVLGVFLSSLNHPGFGSRMISFSFWFFVTGLILYFFKLVKK